MTRFSRWFILAAVLAVATVFAVVLVGASGCSHSATSKTSKTAKPATKAAVLGPYPMNVTVHVGSIGLTLTSVLVQPSDAQRGSTFRIVMMGATQAPAGSRYVDVTLRIDDPTKKYSKAPLYMFRSPVVVAANGKTISVGMHGTSANYNDPFAYTATMEFAIPDDATSAVLLLQPKSKSSAAVSFRLW